MRFPIDAPTPGRLSRRQLVGGLLACAVGQPLGCTHFSPFEIDLPDDETNLTSKQLLALSSRPPPGELWRFAVVSDTHLGYDNLSDIVSELNGRPDLEFVIVPGDLTDLGLREEYRTTLAILTQLCVPFFTTIGNHDAISNGKELYSAMFGALDYSFSWGGIKFVLYNDNALEFEHEVPDTAWLNQQVTEMDGQRAVIAVAHIPPTAEQSQWLADRGVLAWLGGHIHRTHLSLEPLPVFTAPHGAAGRYALVEVNGTRLSFFACEAGSCEAVMG